MAATATTIERDIALGDTEHLYLVKVVVNDYVTGGVSIDASANSHFDRFEVKGGGYVTEFIPATQKLKIYRQKDPANAGGADIPLPEVANAADLSGQTWYGIAIGA